MTAAPPTAPVVRGDRYPALDGLRAQAVLLVVATHVGFQTGQTFSGPLGAVLARGDAGVALFFLLSGFLLYAPHARAHLDGPPPPPVRRYLRHRALRVLPAYWVLVAVVLLTLARDEAAPGEVAVQLLLLQVYAPDHLLVALTHTWSLAVEASYYLVLPLLAAALAPRRATTPERQVRRELLVLAALAALAVVWVVLVRGVGAVDPRVGGLWLP